MGAVNLRRMTDDVFEQRLDIDYGVTSRPSSGFYYLTKEDFTSTRVFQRLLSLFGSQPIASQSWISLLGGVFGVIDPASIAIRYGIDLDTLQERVALIERKPHIKVLGKATVDLLEGLFKEIDEEKWQKINRDLVLSQVFQTALFLIQEHLANAELSAVSGNFNKFAEKIELVHAELATLMELVKPFKATDFDEIYQKELLDHSVPLELAGCLSAGLGKTGVNIFTGIALAAKNEGQSLQGVHGLGLYFEETLFTPHEFESFMTTPSLPKISLYLGQFNPNIDVGSTLTEYKPRDVAADVRRLLDSGRVQTNFTVAVDVTIDEFYSKSSKKLLDQFKSEILAGKINFIFFSSVIGHGGT